MTTALVGQTTPDGLSFTSAWDHVTCSRAIAIDARGERVAADTACADGRIRIRVPAAFTANAALPLVIDPRVASAVPATGTTDLADPDVCGSALFVLGPTFSWLPVWSVVFARYFGGSDWDCYVQNLDANLNLLGAPLVIDFTSATWQRPRIASLATNHSVLVVAEVRGSGPVRVAGREVDGSLSGWAVQNVFDIANDGTDNLRPGVGGDPDGTSFSLHHYMVVWEHAASATDHDIHARLVDPPGVLLGSTPIYVETNTLNQSNPAISKGCPHYPVTGHFALVWQQTFSSFDEDIYGCLLTRNGVPVPVNGNLTFVIDSSGARDTFPQVSSPTQGSATVSPKFLAVWERAAVNNGDIMAACFDTSGAILARADVSVLENDPVRLAWPQYRPSVDSDGARFGVAYHELYQNNAQANDTDTRMSLVAYGAGALFVEEPAAILGFSGNREFNAQVAYNAYPNSPPSYCTVNDRDNVNNTFAIDAFRYDGVPPGPFAVRATGCGTLTIAPAGISRIGEQLTFTINSTAALAGFVMGPPVNTPLGPCPGCTAGASGLTVIGASTSLTVPFNRVFIGAVVAVQGFQFDPLGGPCLGMLHVTDTVDCLVQ